MPKNRTPSIRPENLYGLDQLDPRLRFGTLINPTADHARSRGFEGIVLRQGNNWIKVKPTETHDVPITGFVECRGKHAGRLGIVHTLLGSVGSGYSDEERVKLWSDAQAGTLVGQTIEISCMEFTSTGKFRHPIFIPCDRTKTVTRPLL